MDKQSYEVISTNHNNSEYFESEHHDGSNKLLKFDPQGNKDNPFNRIMISKFQIIHSSLIHSDHVLYIDGDIVIKKNIEYKLLNSLIGKIFYFKMTKKTFKTKPDKSMCWIYVN